MNKGERLIFGDSLMTHAMVITAFSEKVCFWYPFSSSFSDEMTNMFPEENVN